MRLSREGFRLFFPICAVYAACFPANWLLSLGLGMPLSRDVPASLWHAYEMIVGALGAALIGFLTTAVPELTDTRPPTQRALWSLMVLWGFGRLSSLWGWSGFGAIGAVADLIWILALAVWLGRVSILRQTDRLLVYVFWLVLLATCAFAGRMGYVAGQEDLASTGIHLAGFAFLGLLGLSLARITVPVTNLILDPTERTSPYRPHPGRQNLAPGLVLVATTGEALSLSPAVTGFLIIAAGAAFMDRVSEAFIGWCAARSEILMLAGSSALAGIGLIMVGAARLGAPWAEVTGLHVAFMGGLGLGIYAVFSIAGLLHTDRSLGLSRLTRFGALVLVGSVLLRIAPEIGVPLPGPIHAVASLTWALAFLIWLGQYWPYLVEPVDPDRTRLSQQTTSVTHQSSAAQ